MELCASTATVISNVSKMSSVSGQSYAWCFLEYSR